MFDRDDGDATALDRLKQRMGGSESKTKRTLDGECDNCGESEGSVIESKEDGWTLCRPCWNDPEVLEEYA
jgi:formylmethanofuran dehydrogenase subunit E